MPDSIAITVENVSKVYRLYGSIAAQALDISGLGFLRFWKKPQEPAADKDEGADEPPKEEAKIPQEPDSSGGSPSPALPP